MGKCCSTFTIVLLLTSSVHASPPPPTETLKSAVSVLEELQAIPAKGIPRALLAESEAVVIVPRVIKVGFIIGGRVGHGVAVFKNTTGVWDEIRFVTLGGASVGFQAGVQSADVVLVFKNRKGLDRILDGKRTLTLGGDVSVAAGPVGRDASAATNARLQSEIYSYARARGLFAGVSLQGLVISSDQRTTNRFQSLTDAETSEAAGRLQAELWKHTTDRKE